MTTYEILNVPYEQRNEAKRFGARWFPDDRCWGAPPGSSAVARFQVKCLQNCSCDDREEVKALGAKWDKDKKFWYFHSYGVSERTFRKWRPMTLRNKEFYEEEEPEPEPVFLFKRVAVV